MVHTKSQPAFCIILLRDTGESPCQMDLLQPVRRVVDTGSDIWTQQLTGFLLQIDTLQQQNLDSLVATEPLE